MPRRAKRDWIPKGWFEQFLWGSMFIIATTAGYFMGAAEGSLGTALAVLMFIIVCGGLLGAFLVGLWVGHLSAPARGTHTRTPACVRGSPCGEALCGDCGCRCGRHGLVVGGAEPIVPAPSRATRWKANAAKPLLDRCAECNECAGWRTS